MYDMTMNEKRILLGSLFVVIILIALFLPRGEETILKDFSNDPNCTTAFSFCSAVDKVVRQRGFPAVDYQSSNIYSTIPSPGTIITRGVVVDILSATVIDLGILGVVVILPEVVKKTRQPSKKIL
jgi:hypothetical protein